MCQVEMNREDIESGGMPFSIKMCEARCLFKENARYSKSEDRKENLRLYKEQIVVNFTEDSYDYITDNLKLYKEQFYIK